MRSHKSAIAATTKKLAKRLEAKGTVSFRDAVAYQINDPGMELPEGKQLTAIGEFHAESVFRDDDVFVPIHATLESENALIDRMVAYITTITEPIAIAHLQENFTGADKYLRCADYNKLYLQPQRYLSLQDYQALIANPQYKALQTQLKGTPNDPEIISQLNKLISAMLKQPVMQEDKKNDMTRFVLNEFALYPYWERGPLTEEGFAKLIQKIQEMASHFPENYQLVLGSVPVCKKMKSGSLGEEETVVQNMTITVDCGNPPKVDPFSKAYPAPADVCYPGTKNAAAIARPDEEIENLCKKINEKLQKEPDKLTYTEIKYLIDYMEANFPHYQNNLNTIRFVNKLYVIASKILQNEYKDPVEEKTQVQTKKPDKVNVKLGLTLSFITALYGVALKAIQSEQKETVEAKTGKPADLKARIDIASSVVSTLQGIALSAMQRQPSSPSEIPKLSKAKLLATSDAIELEQLLGAMKKDIEIHPASRPVPYSELKSPDSGMTVQHAGKMLRFTAGGIPYWLAVDICMDTSAGVSMWTLQNAILNARRKGEHTLPVYASHVLISNTLGIQPTRVITQEVTQADPLFSFKRQNIQSVISTEHKQIHQPVHSQDYRKPQFGAHTRVDLYGRRKMQPLMGEWDGRSQVYNQFIVKLQAMQHYREQVMTLEHIQSVNRIINAHILEALLEKLNHFSSACLLFKEFKIKLLSATNHAQHEYPLHLLQQLQTSLSTAEYKSFGVTANIYNEFFADILAASTLLEQEQEKYLEVRAKLAEQETKQSFVESDSELHLLVRTGNIAKLHDFFASPDVIIDVNPVTADGDTPLHLAAARGDIGMMLLLIENGGNYLLENLQGKNAFEIFIENHDDLERLLPFMEHEINFFTPHDDSLFSLLQHMMMTALQSDGDAFDQSIIYIVKKNPVQAFKQLMVMKEFLEEKASHAPGHEKVKWLEQVRKLGEFVLRYQAAFGLQTSAKMFSGSEQEEWSKYIAEVEATIASQKNPPSLDI